MDNETIRRARRKYLFSEDEKVLYDDEEQEEIINTLAEKNDKNNELYSILISVAFIVLNLFFSYEIITNSFSFLSGFIIFLSWIAICCMTTSFRQYTTHKYYVRVGDDVDDDDDDYNNGKENYDLNGTEAGSSNDENRKPLFKKRYLAYFNILNRKGKQGYKRFDMSNDQEIPNSPYRDVLNYISLALALLILVLTITLQNWWHTNKLIPFVPLIMAVANIYASVVIDETTTEINSLKGYKSPFKGA